MDLIFTLYRSLIELHFLSCSFILEGTSQTNMTKLQVHQNNALQAVRQVNSYSSGTEIRTELNVDSIPQMMKKAARNFAYRGYYDIGPPALNGMFVLYTNDKDLRSNSQLNAVVPKCKMQFGEKSFAYRAVIHWNDLPEDLKATPSDSFKENLKNMPCPK